MKTLSQKQLWGVYGAMYRCRKAGRDTTHEAFEILLDHYNNCTSVPATDQFDAAKLRKENEDLKAEVQLLRKLIDGIKDVQALIADSHGVTGLHLNGHTAPWDTLRTGGQFEEWLLHFDYACEAVDMWRSLFSKKEPADGPSDRD